MFHIGEFRFRVATSPALLEAAHRLRYKVFVDEYKFLKAEDNPGGLEQDEFDAYSIQFVAQDSHGRVVGTVRLIQNSSLSLPVLNLSKGSYRDKNPESRKIAEISRLTLDTSLTGNAEGECDGMDFFLRKLALSRVSQVETTGMDKRAVVLLGLIQILSQAVDALFITDLFLMAEKRLMVLLRRQGIKFHPIGPEIDYHGLRAPFVGHTSELVPVTYLFRNKIACRWERRTRVAAFQTSESLAMGRFCFRRGRRVEDRHTALALRKLSGGAPADIFDEAAYHIIAQEDSGRIVGALPLIPNSPMGLPALGAANGEFAALHKNSKKLGEISGLAMVMPAEKDRGGKRSAVVLAGLLRMAQELASELRLTGFLSVMNSELAGLADQIGLATTPIGDSGENGRPYLVKVGRAATINWRGAKALVSAIGTRDTVPALGEAI